MKAKAALWLAIPLLLGAFPTAFGQASGLQPPGPGASWYLYWMNDGKPGNYAFVTDENCETTDSYATVWSKVYDPDKGTETTTMELYDADNDSVATVYLLERNAHNDVIRKVSVRHPETKLAPVSDTKSREHALLTHLKLDDMRIKSRQEAKQGFVALDKELRAAAKQKPGGVEPACWP